MFSLISLVLRLRAVSAQPAAIAAPIVVANDVHGTEPLAHAA